jgi:hypothetical protein
MTNKTFEPMGLVELTKQLADSAQAHVDRGRKQVADLEDRMHSALDAKRDVASEYSRQLQDTIKRNDAMWKSGYDVGYAEGYNAGRLHGELPLNEETVHDEHLQSLNSMTEDEISQELADAGYDVDELVESVQQTIKDHENKVTKDEQN